MSKTPTYDQKCYDLAGIFLGDEPSIHIEENIIELAELIQATIEEHIGWLKQCAGDNGQFGVGA
jgi:hypothetical protein